MSNLLVSNAPIFLTGLSAIVGETIKEVFDLQTARTFGDMEIALSTNSTQLLVVDLEVVGPDNEKALYGLVERYPLLKILLMYETKDSEYFKMLYLNGILGVLSRGASVDTIIACLQKVYKGDLFIENELMVDIIKTSLADPLGSFSKKRLQRKTTLTTREKLVARLMIEGKSNTQICGILLLHPSTVSTFKKHVFKKLQITNLRELAWQEKVL